ELAQTGLALARVQVEAGAFARANAALDALADAPAHWPKYPEAARLAAGAARQAAAVDPASADALARRALALLRGPGGAGAAVPPDLLTSAAFLLLRDSKEFLNLRSRLNRKKGVAPQP